MSFLIIDSAMNACSVGVFEPLTDLMLAQRVLDMPRGQAEHLIPMIVEVLQEAGKAFADLTAIAVTTGPGAFTGMRIGLSAAKSLALALDLPCIGVDTFQAIFKSYQIDHQCDEGMFYGVLLETKRQDFYFQLFGASGALVGEAIADMPERVMDIIGDRHCVMIGDAFDRFQDHAQSQRITRHYMNSPAPLAIAKSAKTLWVHKNISADPIYLRPPDVSLSKIKQRQIGD